MPRVAKEALRSSLLQASSITIVGRMLRTGAMGRPQSHMCLLLTASLWNSVFFHERVSKTELRSNG